MQDLTTYQNQLVFQKKELQSKLDMLDQKIVEFKIAYQLDQDDLRDDLGGELSQYKPEGISFDTNLEVFNSKLSEQDFENTLNQIFKLT